MSLKAELKLMLKKARRYVRSAKMLEASRDYDSAASRLYYAMFYCAEALLRAGGQAFSSHRAVISAFGRQFVKTGDLPKELHESLRLAFEKRQLSDYEFTASVDAGDVADLRTRANKFLRRCEEFLKREGHL